MIESMIENDESRLERRQRKAQKLGKKLKTGKESFL